MNSALEHGRPIFKCGAVCGWPQSMWLSNPNGRFYCGQCQKPCAIKRFPWVDHWAIWEDWMWNTPGKISDHVRIVFHDEVVDHHEHEGTSQRQIWSEFEWDRVKHG